MVRHEKKAKETVDKHRKFANGQPNSSAETYAANYSAILEQERVNKVLKHHGIIDDYQILILKTLKKWLQ